MERWTTADIVYLRPVSIHVPATLSILCLRSVPSFAKEETISEKQPINMLVHTIIVQPTCIVFQVDNTLRLVVCRMVLVGGMGLVVTS